LVGTDDNESLLCDVGVCETLNELNKIKPVREIFFGDRNRTLQFVRRMLDTTFDDLLHCSPVAVESFC